MLDQEQIQARLLELKRQRADINKEIFDLEQHLIYIERTGHFGSPTNSVKGKSYKPFSSTVKNP